MEKQEESTKPPDDDVTPEKYKRVKRPNKTDNQYRVGPMAIEETTDTANTQIGTLDSDCEDLDLEENRTNRKIDKNMARTGMETIKLIMNMNLALPLSKKKSTGLRCSRSLIKYFSKLGKDEDPNTLIDLDLIRNHLGNGADINFPDKHGQTIFFEVARGWNTDVAQFLLDHGGDLNKSDRYGRYPLHVAAAIDYEDMVRFLVDNGADVNAKTLYEKQTPMHYAAKNNAIQALKVLLKLGGEINARDYKQRTPLFIAAETKCAVSARYLLEQGAPCGVYDTAGTPLMTLFCEKIPNMAVEALDQFVVLDRSFRQRYYYLGRLESELVSSIDDMGVEEEEEDEEEAEKKRRGGEERNVSIRRGSGPFGQKVKGPTPYPLLTPKKRTMNARTPLQIIAETNQVDLIMHPVVYRLLRIKWNLFGKRGASKMFAINLFYTLNWTVLGLFIPSGVYYDPITDHWWRILMEGIGIVLLIYFIYYEINQIRNLGQAHQSAVARRIEYIEKDLRFCHPRWKGEDRFVRGELESIKGYRASYFRDPWNIFEWFTYVLVVLLIISRVVVLSMKTSLALHVHVRVYAVCLIIIWLRLMRSCRAFQSIGPFIAVLGSVISDTMRFAFLFFEFFIPYTVGFWIIFGDGHFAESPGEKNKKHDWAHFHDRIFSTWSMTLMGEFNFGQLIDMDRNMAQLLCGTYFALVGVVCMNLYIALLSDTFARVYMAAQATAGMQQAKLICMLQNQLTDEQRSKFEQYMQDKCSPEVVLAEEEEDDGNLALKEAEAMVKKATRSIMNKIDDIEEKIMALPKPAPPQPAPQPAPDISKEINPMKNLCEQMNDKINDIAGNVDKMIPLLSSLCHNGCLCTFAENVGAIKTLLATRTRKCSCNDTIGENIDSLRAVLGSRSLSRSEPRAESKAGSVAGSRPGSQMSSRAGSRTNVHVISRTASPSRIDMISRPGSRTDVNVTSRAGSRAELNIGSRAGSRADVSMSPGVSPRVPDFRARAGTWGTEYVSRTDHMTSDYGPLNESPNSDRGRRPEPMPQTKRGRKKLFLKKRSRSTTDMYDDDKPLNENY